MGEAGVHMLPLLQDRPRPHAAHSVLPRRPQVDREERKDIDALYMA